MYEKTIKHLCAGNKVFVTYQTQGVGVGSYALGSCITRATPEVR